MRIQGAAVPLALPGMRRQGNGSSATLRGVRADTMNVTIIGTGYVGLVTGACLADMGNHVFCLDLDEAKVRMLNEGGIPIFEPGLEAVVRRNEAAGRLVFSTDVAASVRHGVLQCIAVGTPQDENGSADLPHVLRCEEWRRGNERRC